MPRRVPVVLLAALLMAPATDALGGWRADQAKEPPKEQPKREEAKPAPSETPRRQPTTVTLPPAPAPAPAPTPTARRPARERDEARERREAPASESAEQAPQSLPPAPVGEASKEIEVHHSTPVVRDEAKRPVRIVDPPNRVEIDRVRPARVGEALRRDEVVSPDRSRDGRAGAAVRVEPLVRQDAGRTVIIPAKQPIRRMVPVASILVPKDRYILVERPPQRGLAHLVILRPSRHPNPTIVVVRGPQTTVHDFHPSKFLPLYSQSFASNAFAVGAQPPQSSIRLYDDPAYWRPADYMVSESAGDGVIAEAAAPPCETRPEDALALQILQIRVDFDLLRQLALDYQDGVLAEGDWRSFLGKRILALDSGQAALGDEESLDLADDWAALTDILEKVYVDRPAAADLAILLTTLKTFGEKLDGLSRAAAAMRRRE